MTLMVLLCCCGVVAVLLLCCCCVVAVFLLCGCCVVDVLPILCCCCVAVAVLLMCCCCIVAVLFMCNYCYFHKEERLFCKALKPTMCSLYLFTELARLAITNRCASLNLQGSIAE